MTPDPIHSDDAPQAIGPYSQAVRHAGVLYCSGQVALDPETMEMVGDDAASQCQQVMSNLQAVVEAGGSSMGRVLRCTIYLVDMDDFSAVNEVYEAAFGKARPARACVAVQALPKGALVEIDCIAAV